SRASPGVGPGLVQRHQVGRQVTRAPELAAEQVRPSPVARRKLIQARRPDVRVGGGAELVAGRRGDHGRGDGGADAAALPADRVDLSVLNGTAQTGDGVAVFTGAVDLWELLDRAWRRRQQPPPDQKIA